MTANAEASRYLASYQGMLVEPVAGLMKFYFSSVFLLEYIEIGLHDLSIVSAIYVFGISVVKALARLSSQL